MRILSAYEKYIGPMLKHDVVRLGIKAFITGK